MEKLQPFVNQLIQYYYKDLSNAAGGYLHIVLDDGNIEHEFIQFCKTECEKNGDSFGIFLCDLLLTFTEDELWNLYEKDWFGMNVPELPNFPDSPVSRY